jgi:hypothetical protein
LTNAWICRIIQALNNDNSVSKLTKLQTTLFLR